MVTAKVGEYTDLNGQAFGTILRQPMAGGLKYHVAYTFAGEAGHIGQEGYDIWRRQPGLYLFGGGRHTQSTNRGAILTGHLCNLYKFYGEYTGVRVARKHIAWYSKRQRNGNVFRQNINQLESADAQLKYVCDYFALLSEQQGLAA